MRISRLAVGALFWALSLNFLSTPAQEVAAAPVWDASQKPIVETVERYVEAFNKADFKGLEAFFTDDARLTTVDGEIFQGREAILALFREGIEGNPGLSMRIDIRSVRLIGDSVAIEAGFIYTRTTADPADDVVAYEVVHVKRDGAWRMFDIFETTPADDGPKEPHAEKLVALDFLTGEWLEESETATIEHAARWSPNHRYLLLNFSSVDLEGKPIRLAEQRVSWDPRLKSIRSWLFEEDGGYADGLWTVSADGQTWTIKIDGVLADGRVITGTMKFEKLATDRIRISGYDRTVDGKELPDAASRHLVRKPPEIIPQKSR